MQAVNGAKLRGAAKIIGIDKNPWKKQKGEAFGITDFINPSEKPEKSISELVKEKTTDGMGVDYSFECSGVISLVSQLIAATKMVCMLMLMLMCKYIYICYLIK